MRVTLLMLKCLPFLVNILFVGILLKGCELIVGNLRSFVAKLIKKVSKSASLICQPNVLKVSVKFKDETRRAWSKPSKL